MTFRGGGKSCASSVQSWRVKRTPESTHRSQSAHFVGFDDGTDSLARVRLQRIDLLPVNMRLKMHTTSLVIPNASWGSWTSLIPMRQFAPLVKRVAGCHHGQDSDELFYILTGHGLNAEFCAGAQAFFTNSEMGAR